VASSRRRRIALPRRLGGVLAGTALSCIAIATSLVTTWLGRGEKADDNGSGVLLIAAAAAVPAFLLGATALVLLSERTSNAKITGTLTALAVFISLIPLEIIFLRETWAVFVFSALFAVLVALVLSESAEPGLPGTAMRGSSFGQIGGKGDAVPTPPPLNHGEGERAGTPDHEVTTLPHRHVRRARRSARRAVLDSHASGRHQKRLRHRALRRRPVEEARAFQVDEGNPPPAASRESNDLLPHLVALCQELESSIERLELLSTAIGKGHEEEAPTSALEETDQATPGVSVPSEVATYIMTRFDALCKQLESCVERFQRLATDVDERPRERLPTTARQTTESIGPQPHAPSRPPASSLEDIRFFREQIDALIGRLGEGITGDDGPDLELQVIRSLRERLARFLQELEVEDSE